ncbi:MAG: GH92 family glycosyl hydrolase [Tannerellaceae bacterium]|jgi:predicted alpha-1,2-mannosidase|nr:GH92 family glycosyl hydrolase [Tannerellaceae bacterium]
MKNIKIKITVWLILSVVVAQKAIAGPYNIAPLAKVTVLSGDDPGKAVDGIIGIDGIGEWASTSKVQSWGEISGYPWIQLDWDTPRSINRVILYDRAGDHSHTAGGTLLFDDGTKIYVTTIPNDGTAKAVDFPAKRTKWIRFVTTDGDGPDMGLSEIEVYPSAEEYVDYVSKVDPYIETARGRYFFFVTGSRPFGMISAAPLTRNKNQGGGGYNYNSTEILGFPQVHGWMISGISLMPAAGEVNPVLGEQGWKSSFSHDGEIVQPGYHRVFLNDYNIWVEQTCTDRVSFYKFRYTEDATANILVNLGGYLATTTMNGAEITKVSDREIEGSVNTTGRLWGGPDNVRIFFVMRFDKPFETLNGWNGQTVLGNISRLEGSPPVALDQGNRNRYSDAPPAGVSAVYQVKKGDEIQVKCAISYTTIGNARNNMDTECNHWDFGEVRESAKAEWNEWLGRIDVKGGSAEQQTKFYTDLWHVLLGRHKIDDLSGDYPDYTQGERSGSRTLNARLIVRTLPEDAATGKARFHMYNSDAFWLTQWNLNILWGLAWPETLDDFAACLVQYAENGGLLPRGPNIGGYSFIMTGCPATNLIVSAYQKGMLTKTDPRKAYKAMVDNHQPGGMIGDEKGIKFYLKNGYYPGNAGISLEIAFQDWALSQMATRMGKKRDAAYYLKRSQGWEKLFNAGQQLIFTKDTSGNWLHTDPLNGNGWIEANSWQATWSISHAIPRLAQLMGGNDVLCDKLNYAFEQSAKDDFVFGYGGGHISYANQPGCSNAHVFNYAGKPWLSQYWVRRVQAQAYGATTPNHGYGGHDEDQGQMGGVSALMAIGLFSLQGTCSADPAYELTSPIFDDITIKLNPRYYTGKEFRITVNGNTSGNDYIQKIMLNNQPHNTIRLNHSDFSKGGTLELWLGNKPNKALKLF